MKKIYSLILIASFFVLTSSGQVIITGFTVVPANPTTADTVTIYVQCDFVNSGCDGSGFLNSINGNVIDAGGLHCMGSLAALCTDYDTIVIPPLAAGTYTFQFLLVTGVTTGCIPNIVPLVMDSTNFTVSFATGIDDSDIDNALQILPNPSNGKFAIKHPEESSVLKIFSADGKLVTALHTNGKETEVNCDISSGVYTVTTESNDKKYFSKLVVVR